MNKISNNREFSQTNHQSDPVMLGDDIVVFSDNRDVLGNSGQYIDKESIVVAVCTRGEALVNVNGRECRVGVGTMSLKGNGCLYTPVSVTDDYSCCGIAISLDFLKNLPFDLKSMITAMLSSRNEPCFELTENQQTDLINLLLATEGLIQNLDFFKSQSVQGVIYSLLCFICNLTRQREDRDRVWQEQQGQKDRRYYYMLTFLDLLGQYSTQERSVGFYADKMFITPKYLSSIIKEISGKSASEWIDEYVMNEAKTILQQPDMNVSEVAYHLNFSTISFFGKYFKRHAGISPSAFQRAYAFQ
ncbi:helix-turn-helix domain-containing protein [Alistipes sp. OttesenSCG-928-B03]|nr:helix-turn-helix domain-containing protein [Alistipes sp. OttesenSCG-928-B03]